MAQAQLILSNTQPTSTANKVLVWYMMARMSDQCSTDHNTPAMPKQYSMHEIMHNHIRIYPEHEVRVYKVLGKTLNLFWYLQNGQTFGIITYCDGIILFGQLGMCTDQDEKCFKNVRC